MSNFFRSIDMSLWNYYRIETTTCKMLNTARLVITSNENLISNPSFLFTQNTFNPFGYLSQLHIDKTKMRITKRSISMRCREICKTERQQQTLFIPVERYFENIKRCFGTVSKIPVDGGYVILWHYYVWFISSYHLN